MKRFLAAVLLLLLLGTTVFAGDLAAYPDAAGHWAAPALEAAVSAGILTGTAESSLSPDTSVTWAQAAVLLARTLKWEVPAEEGSAWYAPALSAAGEQGLLPSDSFSPDAAMTRAQTFLLLGQAFSLETASDEALSAFSDTESLTLPQRRAAAALVELGVVSGSGSHLSPAKTVTRAEFLTLLYRLTGFSQTPALLEVSRDVKVSRSGQTLTSGLLLAPSVQSVSLRDLTASGPIILQSSALSQCRLQNVSTPLLVLSSQGGDISVASGQYDAVRVAGGSGSVRLSGKAASQIEISRSSGSVRLEQMDLKSLIISGSNNTITLTGRSSVASITVLDGAENNTIILDGAADTVLLAGSGTVLKGQGSVKELQIAALDVETSVKAERCLTDTGLDGVSLRLSAPSVTPGAPLTASLQVSGAPSDAIVCSAQWSVDGAAVPGYGNDRFSLSQQTASKLTFPLSFTRAMPLSHTVSFTLTYTNSLTGKVQTLSAQAAVSVENYPESHYQALDRQLAAQVSTIYEGDFTMDYNIDYSLETKEAFVNVNGYASSTQYLLWINRHTQKVNIFTGSKGDWTLFRTYRCGTGAPSTPTPVGITYVTYKQPAWYMGSYNVYWITRFYPNTGYAFHSRGYYPDDRHIPLWPNIGYPMSAGCIRMYDDAAKWIYDTIPLNTTVVIY